MSDFILFYGEAINKQDQELGVETPRSTPMKLILQSTAVVCIRESFGEEMQDDGSIIYLSSGESFWVEEDLAIVADKLGIKVIDEGTTIK
jgi:hypothetical protein